MNTFQEIHAWMAGAGEHFEDVCEPVCQMFFRWIDDLRGYRGNELVCGFSARAGHVDIMLQPRAAVALPVVLGRPVFNLAGNGVESFGCELIAPGFWSLTPSVNLPELIHGFAVLYNVPQPAPWERVLAAAVEKAVR